MASQSFSVFVNNIPENIHCRWLKQVFQHHGNVIDVFIPQRRSKSGKKFGFVSYSRLKDAKNAVEKLNGAWFLDHWLYVNLASFNEKPSFWRRVDPSSTDAYPRRNNDRAPPSREMDFTRQAKNDLKSRSFATTDTRTFTDTLKPDSFQPVSDDEQSLIEISVQDLKWLEASMMASIRSPLEIQVLHQQMYKEGYSSFSISPMGGSWFLINFDKKESILNLLVDGNPWIEEWFYWIKPWSKELISDERLAWIRISRIPLHAWSEEVFKQIGEHWGKFIHVDDFSCSKQCFDYARILVILNQNTSINNTMELRLNGAKFLIKLEIENESEIRWNQPPFMTQGRSLNLPANVTDSNPEEATFQTKDSTEIENQVLPDEEDPEPPSENVEASINEVVCQQMYDEMISFLNRDYENGGNAKPKFVDEVMRAETTIIIELELSNPTDEPKAVEANNPVSISDIPAERNDALCLVPYNSSNTTQSEEQLPHMVDETQEISRDAVVSSKKSKKLISVSDLQTVEDNSGKKKSISIKKKGPKNRKKTNFCRKKESKMQGYHSDTPNYFDEEILDEDIRNRNRMLRQEAQATLEVAKLLGLSATANEEDIIRHLMEAEIEDMARNICREQ